MSDNKGIHPDSELVVKDWEGTWQEIRETIKQAQERQGKWHDQKRQPAPEYVTLEDISQGRAKKADRVMLNCKNLRTKRPMEKLDDKMFGPFVVKCKVGSKAYEVELPERWDIHPVFHVSLLEPYREDPVGRPQKIIQTPDIVDNEPSYVLRKWLRADGMGILSQSFQTALCNIWLLGKGMVQKTILGNRSRC